MTKLKPFEVIEIRMWLRTREHTLAAIGAAYGVSGHAVYDIARGHTWKHLPDIPPVRPNGPPR